MKMFIKLMIGKHDIGYWTTFVIILDDLNSVASSYTFFPCYLDDVVSKQETDALKVME